MPILSEEDLERFRTKVCTLASSMKCDFGVERCNYSHNLYWARRCPFYLRDSSILRYIPQCCPDVELGEGTKVIKNTCPRGNNCSFAHSYEEIHYHPLVYKTEVCKDYRLGKCKTYYCHLVHGLAEFRVPKEYVLPKKAGLEIPEFAHVKMVDNIRSINTGNVSVGCFQKDKGNKGSEKGMVKQGEGQNSMSQTTSNRGESKETGEGSNIKSWSSIRWKTKTGDIEGINNISMKDFPSITTIKSKSSQKDKEEESLKIKKSENKEKEDESIYDWYKLISIPKVDYMDKEVSLGDIEKNCSMLKMYDNHLNSTLNEFNQLNMYTNEIREYGNHFVSELKEYGYENENKSEALVRKNVNMWNDNNAKKIIEASDNALGTVSSIMGETFERYEEAFDTPELSSRINSMNQEDMYAKVYKQCEVIKKTCKESMQNKNWWFLLVEECKKLVEIAKEGKEVEEEEKETSLN